MKTLKNLTNILEGIKSGITSQFISDIIISLLAYKDEIITTDIRISSTTSYISSTITGGITGLLSLYLDPLAIIPFSIITYNYSYEIFDYIINKDEITITPIDDIFDIGAITILVALFDPNAIKNYKNKTNTKRTISVEIFIAVFINTYFYIRILNAQTKKGDNTLS